MIEWITLGGDMGLRVAVFLVKLDDILIQTIGDGHTFGMEFATEAEDRVPHVSYSKVVKASIQSHVGRRTSWMS
jgi:hypothetical protein